MIRTFSRFPNLCDLCGANSPNFRPRRIAFKSKPSDAIDKSLDVEIDQQSFTQRGQFHVCEKLRFVDRQESFHALQFYDDLRVDQYVDSEAAIELHSLVFNWYGYLRRKATFASESSRAKHCSYADSRRPGPSARWTSMVQPMIFSVKASRVAVWMHLGKTLGSAMVMIRSDCLTQRAQRSQRTLSPNLCVLCVLCGGFARRLRFPKSVASLI